ncbi:histone-like nucleoid-structuring protein Lsr2 [Actinomadura atramentaria]|uniref:histone-like nucleoid-structuring protein Lsr2 n=1 Tax=Actinomadura atramentaria TaxID=1990 RepID=UPI0003A31907|nr:Lsr2 family protein [Actinomadura atramentaria]
MAHRVMVTLVDDIDGGEAEETVHFSLDGAAYSIDLSTKNAERLRDGLEPFVKRARRVQARTAKPGRAPRTADSRERPAEIRAWARAQNIEVNERGRIPANVIEQYEAAH